MIAAGRGHAVTLYEKRARLGGQLNFADCASFKSSLRKFKDYLIDQLRKASVDVRLNTEATPEMIAPLAYDEIVVALGAYPVVPPIPVSTAKMSYPRRRHSEAAAYREKSSSSEAGRSAARRR